MQKTTILCVLMLFSIGMQAQIPAVMQHNNLANGVQYDGFSDIEFYNNEIYISISDAGKIVKTSATTPNAPVVDVITGLNNPSGLSFVGSELYFTEVANAAMAPLTGSIRKFDVTQSNPTVTTLFTGLNYPTEIKASGTKVYVNEVYVDIDFEVDHMEMSMVNLTGTPSKTVLHNQFYFLDDFELKDNFLYILEWPGDGELIKIHKLDVTTGNPTVPTLFYTDINQYYPYKVAILGNMMYLNADSNPAYVLQMDLSAINPTPAIVVNSFTLNGNNAYITEMVVTPANMLYAYGDSYNGSSTTYLLYKADLNTLGVEENSKATSVNVYPNPSSDFLQLSNLDETTGFNIYSMEGKLLQNGAVVPGDKINIVGLNSGMYLLQLSQGTTFKFVKK